MASIILIIFNLQHNNSFEEIIGSDDSVEYVEDLLLKTLPPLLGINPIGINLFALYHPKLKIWLCPNQRLTALPRDMNTNDYNFELRIRFLPKQSKDLCEADQKTFDYYFHQVRYDFINLDKKYLKPNLDEEIYGIALQDELRIVIEKKQKVDNNNIKMIVENIFNQRLPIKHKSRTKLDLFVSISKKKVEHIFMDLYYKNLGLNFVKQNYIDQFQNNLANNFYDETFCVKYHNPRNNFPPRPKEITYQIWKQEVIIKTEKTDNEESIFQLKDLMYITIIHQKIENKVQISHVAGAPIEIAFKNEMELRSFVSLLSGYFRLSQRWNFDLCKEYYSPWMDRLRKLCCHGPIEEQFAQDKLSKFSDENHRPFIFQLSQDNFNVFKIVFIDKTFMIQTDLQKNAINFKLVDKENQTFSSHQLLFDYFKKKYPSASILTPNESDMPTNLLLCRIDDSNLNVINKSEQMNLIVVQNDHIQKSKLIATRNKLFCIRYGEIKTRNKVMIKEFINNNNVGSFLREISDWVHLQDGSIVNCVGLTLDPFSVLFEFCQTSLPELFNEHNNSLGNNILIQSAFYVAKALDFIYSKGHVHGFIRFENLFVSHFNGQSIHIKLGDSIGYASLETMFGLDLTKQRQWLPPEYFDTFSLHYHRMTSYVDVWAFGTTIGQIFNGGQCCQSLEELHNIEAPNDIIELLEQCWTFDYIKRIQPYSIFGTMARIRSQEMEIHSYHTIGNYSESVPNSLNSPNLTSQFFSTLKSSSRSRNKLSFSSLSLNSAQTDTTSLNPTDESIYVLNPHISKEMYDLDRIDGNQLSSFVAIGNGEFGKVYKAELQKQSNTMTVAVKIIPEIGTSNLDHEIQIMTKLKHKNIVQILGYCLIGRNRLSNGTSYYKGGYMSDLRYEYKGLVMEYLEFGALNTYLIKKYTDNQFELPFIKYAIDIADGLVFLAKLNIIHRDLAARNILMKSETEVKISDFGLSHFIKKNEDYYKLQSERPIPLKWYAPESIRYHKFMIKSDVWSFGVLLWEIYSFCKSEPFELINYSDLDRHLNEGNRLPRPPNCPSLVYSLMEDCWQYQPEARPSFETILERLIALKS